MTVRALAAVLVLSVAAAGASAASAAPLRERTLAVTNAFPVGDSRTIAAWTTPDGRVNILLAGYRSVVRIIPPAGCPLVAAGARRLLFECEALIGAPAPPREYVVLEPRSGARVVTRAPRTVGDYPQFTAIGEHWLAGGTSFHTDTETLYLDWRTGVLVEGRSDPFGPTYRIDLDRPQLGRRLCRPFARRAVGTDDPASIDRFAASPEVDGRWVLVRRRDGYRFLGRCGSTRRESLGRDASLGSGYAVYTRRETTRLRRLRDGHVFRLRAPAGVLPVGGRAVVRRDGRLTLVGLPR